jgi:hypothetical protein
LLLAVTLVLASPGLLSIALAGKVATTTYSYVGQNFDPSQCWPDPPDQLCATGHIRATITVNNAIASKQGGNVYVYPHQDGGIESFTVSVAGRTVSYSWDEDPECAPGSESCDYQWYATITGGQIVQSLGSLDLGTPGKDLFLVDITTGSPDSGDYFSWDETPTVNIMGKSLTPGVWTQGIVCGDERDSIIKEYITYKIPFTPTCDEFTQTAHTADYSFSDLNTGDYSWALIRQPLVNSAVVGYGLEKWVANIGSVHLITSAYRNPARNARVGGATSSRHLYGDAVDLQNVTRSTSEYNLLRKAALSAGADYVEPLNGPCGTGCVHADWRKHKGPYAQ